MTTTMMMCSFLPNRSTFLNALTCCAHCHKKVEAPFTILKMCTACRSVCYCNVECQKAHRKNHQQQCNQDVEFLKTVEYAATTQHHTEIKEEESDEADNDELFQPIPPQDECPICTFPLPINVMGNAYSTCCGNVICKGCWHRDNQFTKEMGQLPRCAFCREPNSSSEKEAVIRIRKRMEMNDSTAIFIASQLYKSGLYGLPEDPQKAFQLCLRAAELGNSTACGSVADCYIKGEVVPQDRVTAMKYLIKSVQSGNIRSRHTLGATEHNNSNYQRASRHWLISAAAGSTESLEEIGKYYKINLVTKEEYSTALVSYVNVHKEEWSMEREVVKKKKKL